MDEMSKLVLNLVGKEAFLAGLLYATSKRGLGINLIRLTNEQIGRLATYVSQYEPIQWRTGDLFVRSDNGRYQKFVDSLIDLCQYAPLINRGMARFEDLAHNKFSEIGGVVERSKNLNNFFDQCAMILLEPPHIQKKSWWRRFLNL